ncbi:hypothetical protein DXG01_001027 [Tephrocybe rancida]|nr:hypothetical protein DXG01_001027 [Tephrocybe rancida]
MAYRQNDPYYQQPTNNYQQYPEANYPPSQQHYNDTYDGQANWDSKSVKSYQSHAGSQVHLMPSYEKAHEGAHPMPAMPYPQNYPPAQHPGIYGREPSNGYSAMREKIMRRTSVRQVALVNGNLVLDVPVPSNIVPSGKQDVEEMSKMRYTAATCDPDDFMPSRYTLRPYLMGRQTELFIVMTMYNEDEILFVKTMNAVIKNVAHLCSRNKSKTWGPDGWQKIVVCVVSDGRNKVNKRTLQVLSLVSIVYVDPLQFQPSYLRWDAIKKVSQRTLYTSSVVVTESGEVGQGTCPVQILFCLKEQNKKKLNSHRWFFNAFGPLIKPNGEYPRHHLIPSIALIMFSLHPFGCGYKANRHFNLRTLEITLVLEVLAASKALFHRVPYKMSNILDKPLESVFGYISVLPGAFSAYRYKALLNGPNGKGPLASYFKGETMHGGSSSAGLFDRILCFEIVTKKKEGWTLKYVKSAKASTDVPASVPEFISQRRRWLNGSLFASIHATVFFFRIWSSGQNFFRKIVLQIEFIYNFVQLIFTWTSLANFYLAFYFLVSSATKPGRNNAFNFLSKGAGLYVFEVFLNLYIALLFIVLVCSLGNRPQGSRWTYLTAIILFGICNILTLWCAGYTVYLAVPHSTEGWKNIIELVKTNKTLQEIVIALLATYGLYFISSFMHFEPWHMFTSFVQYMFLLPSYVNILMMYAMCNLHDVTWGTKGDNGAAKDLGGAKKVKNEDGKEVLEVELPTAREDVEQLWTAARNSLKIKPPPEKESRDAATKQADHDRNSRTNVVLAWVGSNMVMILVFTSTAFADWVATHVEAVDGTTFNPYLTFLFWAFAVLSAVRFLGSFLYLVFRLFGF